MSSNIKKELILPISLAITLLEDSNSVINLDLPIKGDINKPGFSITKVLLSTLNNLILKTATSPFNIIASTLGLKEDELNSIDFNPGSALIQQDQKETLDILVKVLRKKKTLILSFSPSYNKDLDSKVLKEKIFNKKKKLLLKSNKDKYISFLENYYNKETNKLKNNFTKNNVLDKNSYINELKMRIKKSIIIEDSTLKDLAKLRAQNINNYFKKMHVKNIKTENKTINLKDDNSLIKIKLKIKIK